MKALIASTLLALIPALTLAQTGTADTPAKKSTSAKSVAHKSRTTQHVAAKTTPAAKTSSHSKHTIVAKAHTSSKKTKTSAAAAAAATAALAASAAAANNTPLTPQEQEVAQQVYTGSIPCELGASVNVQPDTLSPGRFYIEGKGFKYHMHPVVSSTGAVRLEDAQAGAVWIQIANKSMLLNQKLGQRMADECMSAQQLAVAQDMKVHPPKSLLSN